MAQPSLDQVRSWFGRPVVDSGGAAIGTVVDIYLHRDTDDPVWALVDLGQFGAGTRAVPLASATDDGERISVPQPRAIVVAAPPVEPDETIPAEAERELSRYYGMPDAEPAEQPADSGGAPSVVRSEEELQVSRRRRPGRTLRMKKEIVTDQVTTTVPVRREELRLVEEPITEEAAERAPSEEPELTLHREEPVIETRVVPTEKVRLRKDEVTSDTRVSDELRQERVEVTQDRSQRPDDRRRSGG